jgi:hypothetical protein
VVLYKRHIESSDWCMRRVIVALMARIMIFISLLATASDIFLNSVWFAEFHNRQLAAMAETSNFPNPPSTLHWAACSSCTGAQLLYLYSPSSCLMLFPPCSSSLRLQLHPTVHLLRSLFRWPTIKVLLHRHALPLHNRVVNYLLALLLRRCGKNRRRCPPTDKNACPNVVTSTFGFKYRERPTASLILVHAPTQAPTIVQHQ